MAEDQEPDCGCVSMRWTLFLIALLGIGFGVVGAAVGAALLGTIGKWAFALIGAGLGGLLGYNMKPTSFNDVFFWRKK